MAQTAEQIQYQLSINDQVFMSNDPILTGRDVTDISSHRPASNYSIVMECNGGTQAIGLDERIDLEKLNHPILHIFEGDRLFRALLNEKEVIWGRPKISAFRLRAIGEISDDEDLYFDSQGDRLIADDESLSLNTKGTERFRSGEPHDKTVDVILNGEITTVEKGRLSFSELAKLAFPKLFGGDLICFTVSFSRGPKRRPEGALLEGGKIRVVEGMIFNVSATDKS